MREAGAPALRHVLLCVEFLTQEIGTQNNAGKISCIPASWAGSGQASGQAGQAGPGLFLNFADCGWVCQLDVKVS